MPRHSYPATSPMNMVNTHQVSSPIEEEMSFLKSIDGITKDLLENEESFSEFNNGDMYDKLGCNSATLFADSDPKTLSHEKSFLPNLSKNTASETRSKPIAPPKITHGSSSCHPSLLENMEVPPLNQNEHFPTLPHAKLPNPNIPSLGPSNSNIPSKDKKKNWNALFIPKRGSVALEYIAPEVSQEGIALASIPNEVVELGVAKWSKSLIGFGVGRKLPYVLVKNFVAKSWKHFGKIEVISNGQGCFIFNFEDDSKLKEALEGGPWHIGNQALMLKKWQPNITLSKEGLRKIPIWVKLYGIPLELWTPKGFSYIASVIGVPLCLDSITEAGNRIEFARICIDIEASSPFPEEVGIKLPNGDIVMIKVEYSWKPAVCSWCNIFGHFRKECKLAPKLDKTNLPLSNQEKSPF